MCQWLHSLFMQSHHLCTQVHLCLAGCESGARWAAQQNGLLGYTGGSGTNALGSANQLGRRWGGGQVDLRGERMIRKIRLHTDIDGNTSLFLNTFLAIDFLTIL